MTFETPQDHTDIRPPALSLGPLGPRKLGIACPSCPAIRRLVFEDETGPHWEGSLYDDGDTIFGLHETLIARGLVTPHEFRDISGTWFDYGFCMGTCPACSSSHFGATVSMIDPGVSPPGGFAETWFFHNHPHDMPTPALATSSQEHPVQREWLVNVYRTECGILHEHELGPFPWPKASTPPDHLCPGHLDETTASPFRWLCDYIPDLWPDLRAAVVAANANPAELQESAP